MVSSYIQRWSFEERVFTNFGNGKFQLRYIGYYFYKDIKLMIVLNVINLKWSIQKLPAKLAGGYSSENIGFGATMDARLSSTA